MTGGYIGHAVTVANHRVYEGFYSDDPDQALMHGPTFMGNALACSQGKYFCSFFISLVNIILQSHFQRHFHSNTSGIGEKAVIQIPRQKTL